MMRLFAIAFASWVVCLGDALAHVTLEKGEATAGKSYKAIFKVPHGCEGTGTHTVKIAIPEGIIGVKPMPKPGWQLSLTKGPYARSYDSRHGGPVSEGVKEVVWSGGLLPNEFYDEFVLATSVAKELTGELTLYFKVTQECEKGSITWGEIPTGGQDLHALKSPAVALKVTGGEQVTASGPIAVQSAWVRATPSGAKVGAGYLKLTNQSGEADKLIGGTVEGAERVEIHDMKMDGDVMKMRQLAEGLEIAPGATVELKPGGLHLMLMGLARSLTAGEELSIALKFEKAGTIPVIFKVQPIGATAPTGEHAHH